MKKLLLSLVLVLLGSAVARAVELYSADFSQDGVGLVHTTANPPTSNSSSAGPNFTISWEDITTDGSENSFVTQNGGLFMEDFGGVGRIVSEEITLNGANSVILTGIGATIGNPFNRSTGDNPENMTWFYQLDQGAEVNGPVFNDNFQGDFNVSETINTAGATTMRVGFSFNANGANAGFNVTSIRVDDSVPESLTVALTPFVISEPSGDQVTGTVTRAGDTAAALVVNLSSDGGTDVMVPATVTIPAGEASATFMISVVDDSEVEMDELVTVTATASGFIAGTAVFEIMDDEAAGPMLTARALPAFFDERSSTSVTIRASVASMVDETITFTQDPANSLRISAMTTLPAGQTELTFPVSAVESSAVTGPKTVTVTLQSQSGFFSGETFTVVVSDVNGPALPPVRINEVRIDSDNTVNAGTDDFEYLELYSAQAGASLEGVSLVILGDSAADGGRIDSVRDLSGNSLAGNFFVIGRVPGGGMANLPIETGTIFENSDNISILLVTGFTGAAGQDLDTDDDGELDVFPWARIVDGVSLVEMPNPPFGEQRFSPDEFDYSAALGVPAVGPNVTPMGDRVPAHVFRLPDGTGDFRIGAAFDPNAADADDSPGVANMVGGGTGGGVTGRVLVQSFSYDPATGQGTVTVLPVTGATSYSVEQSATLGEGSAFSASGVTSSFTTANGVVLVTFTAPAGTTRGFYRVVAQ